MEILGGLSTDLKEKIAATKVVVIGKEATGLIDRAIRRMGFLTLTMGHPNWFSPGTVVRAGALQQF